MARMIRIRTTTRIKTRMMMGIRISRTVRTRTTDNSSLRGSSLR